MRYVTSFIMMLLAIMSIGCAHVRTRSVPTLSLTGYEAGAPSLTAAVAGGLGRDSLAALIGAMTGRASMMTQSASVTLGTSSNKARANVRTEDPTQIVIDKYAAVVAKCRARIDQYVVDDADRADRQEAAKTLINTITGIATGAGGTVAGTASDQSTANTAGWVTLGLAGAGVIANYVVRPGEKGLKAREDSRKSIEANETALKNFFKVAPNQSSAWTIAQKAEFAQLSNSLDASCDIKL